MFKKEERIRTEFVDYKNQKQIQYVHACKDCGKEVLKTAWEEKNSTGYCTSCSYKHKRKKKAIFDTEGKKQCNRCKRFLETSKFIKKGSNKEGFSASCSKCHNLKVFGITSLDYERLFEEQGGVCAICKNPESAKDKNKEGARALALDHCHSTNKVRGLLCTNCNTSLGGFKDSIELLRNAIVYLKV